MTVHRFADCVLDLGARTLHRSGEEQHLSPKAFSLLALLLEQRPRALTHEQIHEKLWPKTFVSDVNLAVLIAEVRRAVGDSGRAARVIRTVHRVGYAFQAVVDEGPAPAERGRRAAGRGVPIPPLCRVMVWGVGERLFGGGEVLIGRDPQCDIQVDSPTVSRRHARLTIGDSSAAVEDLGSKNGTLHNGAPVAGSQPLADGDEIRAGVAVLSFHWIPPSQLAETVSDTRWRGEPARPAAADPPTPRRRPRSPRSPRS